MPLDFNNLKIVGLTNENIPEDFYCVSQDLNEFIKDDAFLTQQQSLAITNLVLYNEECVGFFSLAADNISLNNIEVKEEKLRIRGSRYPEYPAIKIARLAICKDFERKKVGTYLLQFIVGIVIEKIRPEIGVRFISVDAKPKSVGFYKKFDFIENIQENVKPHSIMMDLLKKLLGRIKEKRQTISLRFDLEPIEQ